MMFEVMALQAELDPVSSWFGKAAISCLVVLMNMQGVNFVGRSSYLVIVRLSPRESDCLLIAEHSDQHPPNHLVYSGCDQS